MSTAPDTPSGLAHRSVTNIRSGAAGPGQTSGSGAAAGPTSPHTPARGVSSAYGSPSSLRAEEDTVIIEVGSRFLRVGFAGDSSPKAIISSDPAQQRRTGDFTTWLVPQPDAQSRPLWPSGDEWFSASEIWSPDLRSADMGLVGDKLERALREAFTKYLLIDSRPRRMSLVLPSAAPIPLISTVLDTVFGRFQAPIVSLVSCAAMCTVAAGLRSALVVDIGWSETIVSSVYEYREVKHTRSIRGSKMLVQEVHDMLSAARSDSSPQPADRRNTPDMQIERQHVLSFEECEEVARRMSWCRPANRGPAPDTSEAGLATLHEQAEPPVTSPDEAANAGGNAESAHPKRLRLASCSPPEDVELPFEKLSDPCENTFIAPQFPRFSFDDEEMPVPQLIYEHLLSLPIDVRATCMSRIMFTGGGAEIPGLKQRLFDEVSHLVRERGWDPVQGKGADQVKSRLNGVKSGSNTKSRPADGEDEDEEMADAAQPQSAADAEPEEDPVEKLIQRGERDAEPTHGTLRALNTLGAWSGASLVGQLKTMAVATIDREVWQQHGVHGASRPNDVDYKAQQRQSLGPAGNLLRGTSGGNASNWTLGAWGAVG